MRDIREKGEGQMLMGVVLAARDEPWPWWPEI